MRRLALQASPGGCCPALSAVRPSVISSSGSASTVVQENGSAQASPENLEQKVNRLNLAIEDVRRQLESMAPESSN